MGAVLVMLPALKLGLAMDDLPQRAVELRPENLPPRIYEVGIPLSSGSFSTVLRDVFFHCSPQEMTLKKNYGMMPWWASANLRLGLWRPLSALTHWLDYRLFPDSPLLMHAHNIAWFAAVAFLVALVYRKMMLPGWAAGLAALMFLLDANTYFPVAFVANRGFILSLCLGLVCLYEHRQWRCTKSGWSMALSAVFLGLSLLANEGGASTLAFLLAYALVLEPGSLRSRVLTVLPAILVIAVWRTIYSLSGFGVFDLGMYLDPSLQPLQFLQAVVPRAMILLGGQLAHVPPDLLYVVNPALRSLVTAVLFLLTVGILIVVLPWIRRDKTAVFWFVAMILATVVAATVMPTSKNLGFVAVGAYGLIASFLAGLAARPSRLPRARLYRIAAWAVCMLLLAVYVPGAIAGRVLTVGGIAAAL